MTNNNISDNNIAVDRSLNTIYILYILFQCN